MGFVTDFDTIIGWGKHGPGVAAGAQETFTEYPLLIRNLPRGFTKDFIVPVSTTIELFEVVGVDANGKLVPAKWADGWTRAAPGNAIPAIGISAQYIKTDATNEQTAQAWMAGHWNIDALAWDATWIKANDNRSGAADDVNQDIRMLAAFDGAPHPTQILLGFNEYHRRPVRTP